MPPLTVASLATMSTSRPETRPMPVTIPAAGRFVVVDVPRGKRRELEKGGARIEQLVDAFAHRQFALRAMPFDVFGAAALARDGLALAQLAHQLLHPGAVGAEGLRRGVDVGGDGVHGNAEC